MPGNIRITPDTMRERASEYRNHADSLNDIIVGMDNLLDQLQSEWEGSSSDAYANKYAELKPGFVEAEDLIRNIASALDSTAQSLEETDNGIANGFNS